LTGGGKSVVGNVTVSFCATIAAAVVLGGLFLWAGASPATALLAVGLVALVFLIFLLVTLRHVAAHPDAAVTSEESYARVIESRMGAKDPQLIRPGSAVLGGPADVIAAIPASDRGADDE
jgi:hypothetical protein